MARAIWKGTISFGLVTIPVELHSAVRENRPRFRLLHGKDLSPVEYRRVCQKDGKAVAWEDIVKGYEYEPGQFVVLTKDDFETAALEKSRTVHVLDFVKQADIDDRFYDVPYYVLPSKGGEPAYAVLREALRTEDKVGVSRVMLREVQHLAALGVVGDLLVLTLMRFADELVDLGEFHVPARRDVRPKELQMARTLVDHLTSKWDPEQYKDDYNENLRRVINSKMKGKTPRLRSSDAPVPANVVDLMARLKESLAQRSPARSTKRKSSPARGRKRTKKVA
jgi:DNA end-binding protein Ku